jgi:hypothetical protein
MPGRKRNRLGQKRTGAARSCGDGGDDGVQTPRLYRLQAEQSHRSWRRDPTPPWPPPLSRRRERPQAATGGVLETVLAIGVPRRVATRGAPRKRRGGD